MDYNVKINEFEGPLDLLLHLIKKSNISIYDISITEITKQYLDYINEMKNLNINVASSYLVMASELLELKSKSLLPSNDEEDNEEEENPKEKLIQRLIEYQKYKEITNTFKELETKRADIYTKLPESIYSYIEEENTTNKSDINALLESFQLFLERQKFVQPMTTKVTNKEYSVKERTREIKEILLKEHKVKFTKLFSEFKKDYIIVTFLSILEMAKDNTLKINQDHNFEEITIELNEGCAK